MSGNASGSQQALAKLQDEVANTFKTKARGDSDDEDIVHIHYPPEIKRRIAALRKLQTESMQVEAEFYKAVCELEVQFANKFQPLYDHRRDIVTGKVEPSAEEANWKLPSEEVENKSGDASDSALTSGVEQIKLDSASAGEQSASQVSGIPGFWLRVFKNAQLIADMVEPHDEPILEKLVDVVINMHPINNPGFTIEFHFAENEYFTNRVLVKNYKMKLDVEKDDPFSYEGPEIIGCSGCSIEWNKGKNVTVKTIKKVQKHKKDGVRRTVSKQIKSESFFNFFDPPKLPDPDQSSGANAEEIDPEKLEDIEESLSNDFEIGHFLRDRVVPRAILYFTGEAIEEVDEDYEDAAGEDDEDEENDEDKDDDDIA